MNWFDIGIIVVLLFSARGGIKDGPVKILNRMVELILCWFFTSQIVAIFVSSTFYPSEYIIYIPLFATIGLVQYLLPKIRKTLFYSPGVTTWPSGNYVNFPCRWKTLRCSIITTILGLSPDVNRLVGLLLGLIYGAAISAAIILLFARATYSLPKPFEPIQVQLISEDALAGSTGVRVFKGVVDDLPLSAFGFIYGTFSDPLDMLEERRF